MNSNLFTEENILKILRRLFSFVIFLNLCFIIISYLLTSQIWISISKPMLWVITIPLLMLGSLLLESKIVKRMLSKVNKLKNDTGKFTGILIAHTMLIGIIQGPILLSTVLFLLYGNLLFTLYSIIGLIVLYFKIPKSSIINKLMNN
ncbi:MAG: hypothetical protein ACI9N1_000381 [Flavobacteriales bacterium]|jgi:hypothetical protein